MIHSEGIFDMYFSVCVDSKIHTEVGVFDVFISNIQDSVSRSFDIKLTNQ